MKKQDEIRNFYLSISHEPGTLEYAKSIYKYIKQHEPKTKIEIKCDDGWYWVNFILPEEET